MRLPAKSHDTADPMIPTLVRKGESGNDPTVTIRKNRNMLCHEISGFTITQICQFIANFANSLNMNAFQIFPIPVLQNKNKLYFCNPLLKL